MITTDEPKKASSYHHGNLKEALITTALEMVENEGLQSITVRELTRRLGTSRSAIYRHFDSKDALMKAVILAGFEKLDAAVRPSLLQRDKSVLERFHSMGRAYIGFAVNHPSLYRVLFGDELKEEREDACDMHDATQATGFHALVELVVEAQEEKILQEGDAMMQATVIWSMVHGLSNLLIDGHVHIQDNLDTLYELSFQTLVSGLVHKRIKFISSLPFGDTLLSVKPPL